jgi:hypothetical protein
MHRSPYRSNYDPSHPPTQIRKKRIIFFICTFSQCSHYSVYSGSLYGDHHRWQCCGLQGEQPTGDSVCVCVCGCVRVSVCVLICGFLLAHTILVATTRTTTTKCYNHNHHHNQSTTNTNNSASTENFHQRHHHDKTI